MRTTYAPPAHPDQLPTSSTDWRRRTGLTDPRIIAAYVTRRAAGTAFDADPTYADFFRP